MKLGDEEPLRRHAQLGVSINWGVPCAAVRVTRALLCGLVLWDSESWKLTSCADPKVVSSEGLEFSS